LLKLAERDQFRPGDARDRPFVGFADIDQADVSRRTVARSRGERVAALQAEIDALKPQVGKPDPALMERATTLEKELNAMKASFQNERSPEFIEKFDNRIKTNEETAVDVLSRNGLPEALIENIKKNGIRSIPSKQMTEWLSKLDVDDKKALEDAYTGNKSLSKEREAALEEIRKNPEKYEAKVKAERTQQFQTYTKEMADYTQQVTKDLPWAKQQEIPADATPEVKARLEKENKLQKELEDVFQRSLYPSNATVRAQTALSACLAHKLALDLSDMQGTAKYYFEESKKLQAEIDTIKKAGITSRAGANVARSPNANTGTLESKLALSDDDAVEAGLREVGA
jgi:hypothetical protein